MKKSLWFLTAVICIISLCSCSKDNDVQTEKQTLAMNGTPDESNSEVIDSTDRTEYANGTSDVSNDITSESTVAEISESTSTVQTGVTQNEINVENGTVPYNISTGTTIISSTTMISNNEELAENIFGAQGKTDSEWLAFGQELYKEGCDTAFRFLCTGSQFPFDRQNLEIIDKTYFLTTCSSFDEATEPYYKIFSRQYHSSDFDGLLIESDGRLYAARAARGMDMTYLSSEVDELVKVTDTEIVFSVIVEYEDGETTAEFTLVPEDGEWKIGKFTLPY